MIGKVGNILAAAMLLIINAGSAAAQGSGALTSKIELEKLTPATAGQPVQKTYVDPDVVVPGNRVRVTLTFTFTNDGAAPASGVNLVNPIPKGLAYDDTADTAGFGVSIDGGKNFGPLASLIVPVEGATGRPATAAEVTHVRWLGPTRSLPARAARSFFSDACGNPSE